MGKPGERYDNLCGNGIIIEVERMRGGVCGGIRFSKAQKINCLFGVFEKITNRSLSIAYL